MVNLKELRTIFTLVMCITKKTQLKNIKNHFLSININMFKAKEQVSMQNKKIVSYRLTKINN